MYAWVVVPLYVEFIAFVTSLDFAEFRATKVLSERCARTDPLSVSVVERKFLCALKCSRDVNCRRFMIRKQPYGAECSLYREGENCATLHPSGCSCYMKKKSQLNGSTLCPIGLYGHNCENVLKDCSEGEQRGWSNFNEWVRSYIKPVRSARAFEVTCEFEYGGFTVFMARDRNCEKCSFNRNITEYVDGFGDAGGDYWLGLTRIKEVLDNHPRNWLRIILLSNKYCENYYDNFSIGAVADGYPIHLGQYDIGANEKCGDSITGDVNIEGSPFSAPGSDQTSFNCADTRKGGWWYANDSRCSESDLMGPRGDMLWPTDMRDKPQGFVALRISPYL